MGGYVPANKINIVRSAIDGTFTDLAIPRERLRNALQPEDLTTEWYQSLSIGGCTADIYEVAGIFLEVLSSSSDFSSSVDDLNSFSSMSSSSKD